MKVGKLLTLTALATGITLGAFVDSAEARRRAKYGSRGQDQSAIGATFDLVDRKSDEQPIIDTTIIDGIDTDINLGFFEGAIENYNPIREPDFSLDNIPVADISLPPGSKAIDVADLKATLSSDGFITYEILQQNGDLIENFQLGRPTDGNFFFSDFFLEIEVSVSEFSRNKAINDISYILDNNLLSATLPSLDRFPPNTIVDVLPDTVLRGIEGSNKTVPESSMIGGLLILGISGTMLLGKSKLRNRNIG